MDIGANVGQFALAVRQCIPEARIDSFEPLPVPAKRFLALFQGDDAVVLHPYAIGPEACTLEMHVAAAQDSSSLLPIGEAQARLFPGTQEVGRIPVKVAPLHHLISAPLPEEKAVIKIDVQGFELEALRGCEHWLDRFLAVYVECSFMPLYEGQALAHEVIDWLHPHGFLLAQVGQPLFIRRGMAVQADFLFLRREILDSQTVLGSVDPGAVNGMNGLPRVPFEE